MSISQSYQKLYTTIIDEHRQVFDRQNVSQLEASLHKVEEAKRVFVIGVGREGIAARSFAMRLMHLGKEVHWIWDDTTPGICPGDLLIAVNGSGRIGHINYVIRQAKAAGGSILVVTGSPSGEAGALLADEVLFVPASVYNGTDEVVSSIQPMGNLFEQHLFMLFDVMVMLLEQQMKITHDEMASRHRNVE
nr:SIS domain-containing protein [uncultured Sphaerochaeta sp.]